MSEFQRALESQLFNIEYMLFFFPRSNECLCMFVFGFQLNWKRIKSFDWRARFFKLTKRLMCDKISYDMVHENVMIYPAARPTIETDSVRWKNAHSWRFTFQAQAFTGIQIGEASSQAHRLNDITIDITHINRHRKMSKRLAIFVFALGNRCSFNRFFCLPLSL